MSSKLRTQLTISPTWCETYQRWYFCFSAVFKISALIFKASSVSLWLLGGSKIVIDCRVFFIKLYFFRASHLELRRQQHRSSRGPELWYLPVPRCRLRRPLQAGQQQTGPLRDLQIQQEANGDQPQKELQWSHGESQGTNLDHNVSVNNGWPKWVCNCTQAHEDDLNNTLQ